MTRLQAASLALALTSPLAAQSLVLETSRPVHALSSDGTSILSAPDSGAVSVWRLGSGWTELGGPSRASRALSEDGAVVLAGDAAVGGFLYEAAGGWTAIGGAGTRFPLHLSGDGQHVVGRSGTNGISGDAFLWDRASGSVTTLGKLGPNNALITQAIDHDGDTICGSIFSGGEIRGAVWDASGAPTVVEPFAGGRNSAARGVSRGGEWVVGTIHGGVAFRWSAATGIEELPSIGIPSTANQHNARYVSDDGSVIVGDHFQGQILSSFIAIEGTETEPLRDVIVRHGGPDLGSSIIVRGMSSDGTRFLVEALGSSYWIDLDAVVSTPECDPAVVNSTGAPAQLVAVGSDVASHGLVSIDGSSLPSGATVVALASMTPDFVAMPGGSDGNLCLGGALGRLAIGATAADGTYRLRLDPSAMPSSAGPVAIAAGDTWRYQLWYRDGASSNFSSVAVVAFE